MTIGTNSIADWTRQASDWTVLVDLKGAAPWRGRRDGSGSGSWGEGPRWGRGPDPSAVLKAISETDVRG